MFYFPNELKANPDAGNLPFDCGLSFVARSLDGSVTADVLYRILDVEDLRIAFSSARSPHGTVSVVAPGLIRLESVPFTALFRRVEITTGLAEGSGSEEPRFVAIRAALVHPGDDDSNPLAATSTSVRISP